MLKVFKTTTIIKTLDRKESKLLKYQEANYIAFYYWPCYYLSYHLTVKEFPLRALAKKGQNKRAYRFAIHTIPVMLNDMQGSCQYQLFKSFGLIQRGNRTQVNRLGTCSFICQGTLTRRQRREFFGLRVKLPPVTTRLITQI